jgi:transglutaminase-like putative cysteine protease
VQRREFIQKTVVLGGAVLFPAFAVAKESGDVYDISFRFDLSSRKDECAVWVPLPSDIKGFQKVISLGARTNADTAFETTANAEEARTFFAKWGKGVGQKTLDIAMRVSMQDMACDFRKRAVCAQEVAVAERFLLPSAHIPTSGKVAETAAKIVGNEKDGLKKAKKIYDWIVANSYRDESVKGCGIGSPNAMLAELEKKAAMGGKCLDMSALCVALMRSCGIPAREVLGVRIGASRLSAAFGAGEDITKAQHCKVEFFVPSYGWIPCDPADITKLVLKEGIAKESARAKALSEKFFGFWENNWLAFNHARDMQIYPANAQGTLDQFGYPYGEDGGEYIDPFSPSSYRYVFASKKVIS